MSWLPRVLLSPMPFHTALYHHYKRQRFRFFCPSAQVLRCKTGVGKTAVKSGSAFGTTTPCTSSAVNRTAVETPPFTVSGFKNSSENNGCITRYWEKPAFSSCLTSANRWSSVPFRTTAIQVIPFRVAPSARHQPDCSVWLALKPICPFIRTGKRILIDKFRCFSPQKIPPRLKIGLQGFIFRQSLAQFRQIPCSCALFSHHSPADS